MPWVYIEEEYTGRRKTCPGCDGERVIMYSNPPSPRDYCEECGGRGWVPDTDPIPLPEMEVIDPVLAEEGEG